MKQKILFLFLSIFLSIELYAQKEVNNWFFGTNAGLTWNTTQDLNATGLLGTTDDLLEGLPTPLIGSAISTMEGCYTLSDANGDLLFYSDGSTIWNKNHAVMDNGDNLTGHPSSAQSGIIFPYPQHVNKYVAVNQPAINDIGTDPNQYISYSVIDMTMNSGLGAVIEKNTALTGYTGIVCESATAIKHDNEQDYWIVTIDRGDTPMKLYAWLFTSSGITSSPIVTSLPSDVTVDSSIAATGYLKFSPDGKTFAWGTWVYKHLLFGSFDATAGTFSNIKYIEDFNTDNGLGPYGVEFSESGKYLYATTGYNSVSAERRPTICVLDVDALLTVPATAGGKVDKGNLLSATILKEYALSGTMPTAQIGSIQLGSDKRMYVSFNNSLDLVVIDKPNDFSNLQIYSVPNVLPASVSFKLGLPSFSASWWNFEDIQSDKELPACLNDATITFTTGISGNYNVSRLKWDFGDGTVRYDTNMSQTSFSQTYTYTKKGSYILTVTLLDAQDDVIETKSLPVDIHSCRLPVNHNISVMGY